MSEENYIEWLERLEIDVEDTTTIDALKDKLERDLFMPSDEQLDALWSTVGLKFEEMAPKGIHPVLVEFEWGSQVRFGVEGRPGLWGWASVKAFMEEEE